MAYVLAPDTSRSSSSCAICGRTGDPASAHAGGSGSIIGSIIAGAAPAFVLLAPRRVSTADLVKRVVALEMVILTSEPTGPVISACAPQSITRATKPQSLSGTCIALCAKACADVPLQPRLARNVAVSSAERANYGAQGAKKLTARNHKQQKQKQNTARDEGSHRHLPEAQAHHAGAIHSHHAVADVKEASAVVGGPVRNYVDHPEVWLRDPEPDASAYAYVCAMTALIIIRNTTSLQRPAL